MQCFSKRPPAATSCEPGGCVLGPTTISTRACDGVEPGVSASDGAVQEIARKAAAQEQDHGGRRAACSSDRERVLSRECSSYCSLAYLVFVTIGFVVVAAVAHGTRSNLKWRCPTTPWTAGDAEASVFPRGQQPDGCIVVDSASSGIRDLRGISALAHRPALSHPPFSIKTTSVRCCASNLSRTVSSPIWDSIFASSPSWKPGAARGCTTAVAGPRCVSGGHCDDCDFSVENAISSRGYCGGAGGG